MKRIGILFCSGALLLCGTLAHADEVSEGIAAPSGVVAPAGPEYVSGPACDHCNAPKGHDGHFLRWLTFCPNRTPCGVCGRHPADCCTPPLYAYFVGDCAKRWPQLESSPHDGAPAPSYCPTCGGHP